MSRKPFTRTGLASAAALLLAAGGLVAYQAAEYWARRPAAPIPAGGAGPPRADGPERSPGDAAGGAQGRHAVALARPTQADVAAAPEPASEPTPDEKASRELMARMAKLASDLEYNANRGLKEPPQQNVHPFPEPWRPPKDVPADAPPPVIDELVPARGPTRGGTRVTLRGRHLKVEQVMFGTSPASVVTSSEREVVVIAPPGAAGPVPVALTNVDGSYALAATRFTFAD